MTWRRWKTRDAKDDAREYHPSDVPALPGLPTQLCEICAVNLDLIAGGDELPRVVRSGSKAIHVRAPGQHKRIRRTRCGRFYILERQ